MNRFGSHFKMNEEDCIQFVREKMPDFFSTDALCCEEIGDGNINYVFRVSDGQRSLIVKHADAYTRSSHTPNSTARSQLEYEILSLQRRFCPDHIPELYAWDPVMCAIIMQDIGDHENMRYALMLHEIFPLFSEHITDFMSQMLMNTSGALLPAAEKRDYERRYVNPVMCGITDRLVFNEPYTNRLHSNIITPGNEEFVEEELYKDETLKYEAALLKDGFQSKRQCLIHGDLHSGSIFVRKDSTMILDPEFAIVGPAGYDLGNVIAHLLFAYVNAEYTETDPDVKKAFLGWIIQTIGEIYAKFWMKSEALLEKSEDPLYSCSEYRESFLEDIVVDSFGYAGTEIIRRVVGSAKVKDLEIPHDRIGAERKLIRIGKEMILSRHSLSEGKTDLGSLIG